MAGGNVPGNLAPIFRAASQQFRIPANVLAGIASVESNFGANMGPSSAGAVGLMQFEPGTARGLGINPMDERQAIFGAARLLNQYGYQQNPLRAIGAYNGGPGNPQMGYARTVMSEAQRVAGQLGGGGGLGGVPQAVGGGVQSLGPRTVQTFNQPGFQAAKDRFIAGQFLSQQDTNLGGPQGADLGPNPLFSAGLLTTKAPNPANFVSTQQLPAATQQLQSLTGSPLVNVHAGAKGDVNPIPGAVIGRTDMGVDASLRPGAPILAPNDAKVLGIIPNWYAGQPYVAVQLLRGRNAGKVMYVAEQITGVPRPGTIIRRGQPIVRFAGSGTGIEIGWASPHNWQQTLAQATGNTGDSSHNNAPAGINFRSYLGGFHG